MTADESAELVALAAERGLVNAANFNIRFYPLNQHARELVADGGLGEVRLVTGRYFQDWLLLDTDWNWRLAARPRRRAPGGRRHRLALARPDDVRHRPARRVGDGRPDDLHRDPPASRPARSRRSRPSARPRPSSGDIATEDAATILLRFDGGARGAVSISQISPGRKNSLRLRDRRLRRRRGVGLASSPTRLWIGHRERPNEILLRNPALMGAAGQAAAALPGGHVEGFSDTFCALFRAVYADVVAGRPSARPATRRSPTATTRCSSATPSPRAPARAAGSTSSAA